MLAAALLLVLGPLPLSGTSPTRFECDAGVTCVRTGNLLEVHGPGLAVDDNRDAGPLAGEYVTFGANAALTGERVLSAGNYTVVDLGTAAQAQVDWQHGLSCSAGQALTSSGTTALACTSALTASDVACAGTCVAASEGGTGSAPAGDDQVAVSSSSSVVAWKTLPDCDTAATSKLLYDQATNSWSCGTDQTGGAGSAQAVEVSVSLSGGAGLFPVSVTGQTWVTSTSKIVCRPFGTTADGLTPEVIAIAGLGVTVSALVAGDGFTALVSSPYGLEGTVRVHCTGV